MQRLLVVALAACLFLAGCTSSNDSGPQASQSTTAPAPIVNATAGSVTGTVVDEEQRPIAGVRVALGGDASLETMTDAAGAYTLNGLESGSHQIYFERLGFEQVAKKVDVVVGEVTTLNVVMSTLLIEEEPYVRIDQRTFYFNFAWYYVSRAVPIANQTALNSQTCDPCVFHIPLQPKPKQVMTETLWQRSISQTGVNENIEPYYCIGWTVSCTVDGTLISRASLTSNSGYTWADAGAKALEKLDLVRLEVLAGFPGVMIQQRGDIWTSFAYLDSFPDDFTAKPPAE